MVAYNTNWDGTVGFVYTANPYTIGGVTYNSGSNVIVGTEPIYGLPRPVMCYNLWTPLTATVLPAYDMLGFDAGVVSPVGSNSLVDIIVYTNLATYQYNGLALPNASGTLQFEGFVTTSPAEIITGFSLASENGARWAPGITDVQVGNTGAVPEPASSMLAGFALLALCAWARRRSA